MPDDIHVLGRAVIRSNGHVLVARCKGATNTFLPGGHVKQGERMHDAIARELREEVGEHSIVKDYLGAIEHSFDANGQMQHELNHLFEVVLPGMNGTSPPVLW